MAEVEKNGITKCVRLCGRVATKQVEMPGGSVIHYCKNCYNEHRSSRMGRWA